MYVCVSGGNKFCLYAKWMVFLYGLDTFKTFSIVLIETYKGFALQINIFT